MNMFLALLLLIVAEVHSMDWKYRVYPTIDQAENAQWKPVENSKKSVIREYQGFIEYETEFGSLTSEKDISIYLGEIGDVDKTYVNGILIGQTGDFPPNFSYNMDVNRHYFIPKTIQNPVGKNTLKVITYTKYLVNKGLNTKNVVIGENAILNEKKYSKDVLDNFSRTIVPLLCLILAIISFPTFAPKALWHEQAIIFVMGISSFILGICRGRVGFHYFEMLSTYKVTIISSIMTIWLIAVSSIGFRAKIHRFIGAVLTLIALGLTIGMLLQPDLIKASAIATVWFHLAPFFILSGVICVFHGRSKNIPLKIGLVILFFADLNDVLHDLNIIHSISMLQAGLGAFVLLLIANQIIRLRNSWELIYKKEFELESDAKLGKQAAQLAHDIRSPLEALKSAKDEIAKLPEMERMSISLAIGRIEEIAYNLLLMRKNHKTHGKGHTHVKSILWQIVQEKKMQFRNYPELSFSFISDRESFTTFSGMGSETLKRIISNILDNSAEAIKYRGEVKIELSTHHQSFRIEVSDNGSLIPEQVLKNIFEKGFTTKGHGNGLGLHHAKKEIEASKGTIAFEHNGKTVVSINLPLEEKSKTLATEIDLAQIKRIIILDDDSSIHQVWKKKFQNFNVELEHFYKAFNLLSLYNEIPQDCLLLSDYELLGEEINGIDCINKLHSAPNSILVTARADEVQILKACEQYGIKILPKSVANDINIIESEPFKRAVLIDDDEFTLRAWKMAAKKENIELSTFACVSDFMNVAKNFSFQTPIYIDSDLGNNQKGEVLSENIFKMGYSELFLATGYHPEDIDKPAWIKEVLGKKAPFEFQTLR